MSVRELVIATSLTVNETIERLANDLSVEFRAWNSIMYEDYYYVASANQATLMVVRNADEDGLPLYDSVSIDATILTITGAVETVRERGLNALGEYHVIQDA